MHRAECQNKPTECPGCGASRNPIVPETNAVPFGQTRITWLCGAESWSSGSEWKHAPSFGCLNRQLAEYQCLLSPAGTKRERQDRLIEIARRMGFGRAKEALWDADALEYPLEDVQQMVDDYGVGAAYEIQLGLFLGADLYVAGRWSDDRGVEYGTFDGREEAEAWAKALEAETTKGGAP